MTKPAEAGLSVEECYQLFGDDLISERILTPNSPISNDFTKSATHASLRLGDNSDLRVKKTQLLRLLGAQV